MRVIAAIFLGLILVGASALADVPNVAGAHLEQVTLINPNAKQRMGYLLEKKGVAFRGCVIYLEGLGDSIQNHYPYFDQLSQAGYRVLMFDYLGQGGSEGSMDDMRILDNGSPYEIAYQAKAVWEKYSVSDDPVFHRNCMGSPKLVIGWSAGGLAAYQLAKQQWAQGYVLIAPAVTPRVCIGEADGDCLDNLVNSQIITEDTLTSNTFANEQSPFIDPIRPTSPAESWKFAMNMFTAAYGEAYYWKISPEVSGQVFLAGPNDKYIHSDWAAAVLQANAPHFSVVTYPSAYHEIDNEVPAIANDLYGKTIEFLNSIKNTN